MSAPTLSHRRRAIVVPAPALSLLVTAWLAIGVPHAFPQPISQHQISVSSDPPPITLNDQLAEQYQTGTEEVVTSVSVLWDAVVVEYSGEAGALEQISDQIEHMAPKITTTLEGYLRQAFDGEGMKGVPLQIRRTKGAPSNHDGVRSSMQKLDDGTLLRIDMYLRYRRQTKPVYAHRKVADTQASVAIACEPVFDYHRRAILPNATASVTVNTSNETADVVLKRRLYEARLKGEVRALLDIHNRGIDLSAQEYQQLITTGRLQKTVSTKLSSRTIPWTFQLTSKPGTVVDGSLGD
jgi:hypothetical protein